MSNYVARDVLALLVWVTATLVAAIAVAVAWQLRVNLNRASIPPSPEPLEPAWSALLKIDVQVQTNLSDEKLRALDQYLPHLAEAAGAIGADLDDPAQVSAMYAALQLSAALQDMHRLGAETGNGFVTLMLHERARTLQAERTRL